MAKQIQRASTPTNVGTATKAHSGAPQSVHLFSACQKLHQSAKGREQVGKH